MVIDLKPSSYHNLEYYQLQLRKYLYFISVGFLVLFSVLGILTKANYAVFIIIYLVVLLFTLPLFMWKKFKLLSMSNAFLLNVITLLQGYFQESAYVMCFISLYLIIAAILTDIRFVHFLFCLNCIAIVIFLLLGKLTLKQEIDAETGRALVSNVTVLLPLLFGSYIIAIVFSRIYLQMIRNQSNQIELLHQTQDQLLSAEKIQSIQLISGGLAHDFNNMLGVLNGNIDLLSFEPNLPGSVHDAVAQMRISLNQAKDLVHQMLEFSKSRTTSRQKAVEINELVKKVSSFILRGRNSQIRFNLQQDLPSINVDEVQIGQVIQNLVLNASEAMNNGGEISITTYLEALSLENIYHLPAGSFLFIDIHDNGSGISETNKKRIFELFFTTKPNGNGLGLAVCSVIVQNHKGIITFDSEVEKGTTFHVILPLSE